MRKIYLMLIGVMLIGTTAMSQCTELYISEYIEGSSSNKAVELYNPTDQPINLSDYAVLLFGNGATSPNQSLLPTGTIAPYDVFVIANSSADALILAQRDTVSNITFYNGDDALALVKISTGDTLDVIGVIGQRPTNPGTWAVGSGSTAEYTLVRKSTVKAGTKDWAVSSGQWDVYPLNTFSYLGSHTSDCFVPVSPIVTLKTNYVKAGEETGSAVISVSITSPSATVATTVDVSVTGGTATNGTDYNFTSPTTLTFAAGSTADETFTIELVDNSDAAIDKTIFLSLSNVSTGAEIGSDTNMTVAINNDDYFVGSIKDVRVNDADAAAANKGLLVELTGTVYGIDYDGNAGISFTIIDGTGGINIFNYIDVDDYVVAEGDSITVKGKIDFYNGLTEVFTTSIDVVTNSNALNMPSVVAKPTEETESNFIRIEKVWIADTTTVWPDNGNVSLTNGTDTFLIRIDRDIPAIVGTPVLYDTMTITGIGGQFDNSAPYTEGYQIFPRGLGDIIKWEKSVGISEVNAISRVYPNPTNGLVTIETASNISSIHVLNLAGQQVLSVSLVPTNLATIQTSNLSPGVYFIQVQGENTTGVQRIVVR